MKIRCAIVDDEFLARQYLTDYVSKVPFLELVGDFNSPLKAMETITEGAIDLVFLDIRMPDITGTEFLRTIDKKPMVIFTTAYSDYALEGYELDVVDYLLKPFSFERFLTAVNKAKTILAGKSNEKQEASVPQTEFHQEYLVVRADRKLYKINYDDLIMIEGQKAYVTFHTFKKNITALVSMKDLTDKLPENQFVRIHKSYIAGIKHIDELEGNQVKVNDQWLPVGKSFKSNIEKIFGV